MRIACVLPAHNEAASLSGAVAAVRRWGNDRFPGCEFEIVISENGSHDGTDAIAGYLAKSGPDVSAVVSSQAGKGGAVKRGLASVDADAYLVMDVDLSTDFDSAARLVDLVRGGTDLAIASRRMQDSQVRRSALRRAMTWAWSSLASFYLGLGVRDIHCGCKALSRTVRDVVVPHVRDEGFFFDTELLARARRLGLLVAEIGVAWEEPDERRSSVPKFATAWEFLRKLPRLKRDLARWPR